MCKIMRNEKITNNPNLRGGRSILWPRPQIGHPSVERAWIYRPEHEWFYSHHPYITFFKGKWMAIWSNGRIGEDYPGQRVLVAKSDDGKTWSAPCPLMTPPLDASGNETVLYAAGFHEYDGVLAAYVGMHEDGYVNTTVFALTTGDGVTWSAPKNLHVPVVPNHGPEKTASGRLIIAGGVAFPYTDDPAGLHGWTMTGIYRPEILTTKDDPAEWTAVRAKKNWPTTLCEGSFYQTDDGVLHMLLRSIGNDGLRLWMWLTESSDNGMTWSAPVETAFSNIDAKFHCGRLPDGRFYIVSNPIEGNRTPLVLSLSRDGYVFNERCILGEEHYEMRDRAGRSKEGEYGYPHTMIHEGYLYVIISRQKEAVEVLRVVLSDF